MGYAAVIYTSVIHIHYICTTSSVSPIYFIALRDLLQFMAFYANTVTHTHNTVYRDDQW